MSCDFQLVSNFIKKKKIDIFWKLRGNEKFHQVESTRDEIRNVNPIEKNNFM